MFSASSRLGRVNETVCAIASGDPSMSLGLKRVFRSPERTVLVSSLVRVSGGLIISIFLVLPVSVIQSDTSRVPSFTEPFDSPNGKSILLGRAKKSLRT